MAKRFSHYVILFGFVKVTNLYLKSKNKTFGKYRNWLYF